MSAEMVLVRTILAALLVVGALVVQVCVLSRLPLPGATPDLVLVVVVAVAIGFGARFGAVTGFAAGLTMDLAPPADATVGRWALVLGVVGFAAGVAGGRLRRPVLGPVLVVAVAAVVSVAGYAATGAALGDAPEWRHVAKHVIPAGLLYAVLLSPLIVSTVLAAARRFGVDPQLRA